MYLLVANETLELCDVRNFTELYVLAVQKEYKKTLEPCGEWVDDEHIYIEPNALIDLAGTPDENWLESFNKMLESVQKCGWIDSLGRVRAHVKFSSE